MKTEKPITETQKEKLKALAEKAFENEAERTAWSLVRWLALQTDTIESRAVKGVELMVQEGFVEPFKVEDTLFYRLK